MFMIYEVSCHLILDQYFSTENLHILFFFGYKYFLVQDKTTKICCQKYLETDVHMLFVKQLEINTYIILSVSCDAGSVLAFSSSSCKEALPLALSVAEAIIN